MEKPNIIKDRIMPVGVILLAVLVIWYVAVVFLNAPFERDTAARAGSEITFSEILPKTMFQQRPGASCPASGDRRDLEHDLPDADHLQAQPGLSCLDHAFGDPARLRYRHRARHSACRRHRPQPGHGPLADALGHRQPDHPDPGHRADDYRRAQCHRHIRAFAQGADLHLSQLLPDRRRHGEGAAQSRADPA